MESTFSMAGIDSKAKCERLTCVHNDNDNRICGDSRNDLNQFGANRIRALVKPVALVCRREYFPAAMAYKRETFPGHIQVSVQTTQASRHVVERGRCLMTCTANGGSESGAHVFVCCDWRQLPMQGTTATEAHFGGFRAPGYPYRMPRPGYGRTIAFYA